MTAYDSTKFFYLLCLLMVDVLLCVCNALLSVVVLRSLPWDQIPSWNWSSTPFQPFTHCPISPDTFQRERQRGREVERFWYVLIILERSLRIVSYSNISNSCCIMLYPIWSFLQWGSWPSTTSPARKSADFGRWCCLLILFGQMLVRCWSDVGQMLVIVVNWTTKSRHQKINRLVFNTLAESQSFWIRNGKKVGQFLWHTADRILVN